MLLPTLFGTRDLFNISYSRELYLVSKFLHFEEIVRVKMAVCFEMIVSETYTSTTHCADKLPPRGRKQIQIHTDSHWIIDFLRL